MSVSTKLLCHQPGQHHDHAHSDGSEDTKPDKRSSEENKLKTADQRGNWRIHHKAPIEMAGIIEGLQLIAMKSILAIRRNVENQKQRCDQNQYAHIRAKKLPDSFSHSCCLWFPLVARS